MLWALRQRRQSFPYANRRNITTGQWHLPNLPTTQKGQVPIDNKLGSLIKLTNKSRGINILRVKYLNKGWILEIYRASFRGLITTSSKILGGTWFWIKRHRILGIMCPRQNIGRNPWIKKMPIKGTSWTWATCRKAWTRDTTASLSNKNQDHRQNQTSVTPKQCLTKTVSTWLHYNKSC